MADWESYDQLDAKAIAARIKNRRTELGMTQVSLAKLAQVSQQSIWALENGTIKIPRSLPKIAAILNTTPRYLVTGLESEDMLILKNISNTLDLTNALVKIKENAFPPGQKFIKPLRKVNGFAIEATDDALEPTVQVNDVLVIDIDRTPKPGDFVLISKANKLAVRKIKFNSELIEDADFVSTNDMYPKVHGCDNLFGVVSEVLKLF